MTEKSELVALSTFGQRFEYARDRQRAAGTWQDDQRLGALTGIAKSQISEYYERDEAPPAHRVLALARICDVDPGWLAFGELTTATPPEGMAVWLKNRQAASPAHAEAKSSKGKGARTVDPDLVRPAARSKKRSSKTGS